MTETVAAQSEAPTQIQDEAQAEEVHAEPKIDLRRTGINPDFWYPVAVAAKVRKGKTFAATFAGQRIALYRGESGTVYALEDRCAHRQVPRSEEQRLNSSHMSISYAVFCLKKKKKKISTLPTLYQRPLDI